MSRSDPDLPQGSQGYAEEFLVRQGPFRGERPFFVNAS